MLSSAFFLTPNVLGDANLLDKRGVRIVVMVAGRGAPTTQMNSAPLTVSVFVVGNRGHLLIAI